MEMMCLPIHIEEYEVMAAYKLGQEEISRDIPNVGEEALRNLMKPALFMLVKLVPVIFLSVK